MPCTACAAKGTAWLNCCELLHLQDKDPSEKKEKKEKDSKDKKDKKVSSSNASAFDAAEQCSAVLAV